MNESRGGFGDKGGRCLSLFPVDAAGELSGLNESRGGFVGKGGRGSGLFSNWFVCAFEGWEENPPARGELEGCGWLLKEDVRGLLAMLPDDLAFNLS